MLSDHSIRSACFIHLLLLLATATASSVRVGVGEVDAPSRADDGEGHEDSQDVGVGPIGVVAHAQDHDDLFGSR